MRLLSTTNVPGRPGKTIELLQGDLTAPDSKHPFDLLIVSAFPDDYIPTPSSLIGALHAKGLSVGNLAKNKHLDLRANFSCWLSRDTSQFNLGFKRILCFEPLVRGSPPDVVGDIFRALMPILGDHLELRSLAMPIVAAGDQSWPTQQILTPLLDAAIHWMQVGLPLDCIKIVVFTDAKSLEATEIFAAWQDNLTPSSIQASPSSFTYDVFLSYAHEDTSSADQFVAALKTLAPSTKLFLDRQSISIGMAWQPEIFESLDQCKKVVTLLSPSYLQSKVCKEEFNIAWARSRESEQEILFPLYLYSAKLPTYMTYRNYFDCREGSKEKLKGACNALLRLIGSDA